jgi:dienelactone hydrolase
MQIPLSNHLTPANLRCVPTGQVRPRLLELLGLEALPTDVEYQPAGLDGIRGDIRVRSFTFENLLGEPVAAVVCSPRGARESLPGVVCMPGTSASAEELAEERFGSDPQRRGRLVGWSAELARRGFVTVSITLMGCTNRRDSESDWTARTKLLAPYGISPVGVMADEGLRAARLLQSLDGVDAERLGTTGFSLGGQMAWVGMALAPWLSSAASLCGSAGSMATAIACGDRERHGTHFYVPHLLRYFDHGRIVSECIAPRPLLILAPTRDEDMPRAGVEALMGEAGPAYAAADAANAFRVIQPDSSHVFRPEYFEEAAAWFVATLGRA